jgi:hypothetical protein
VTHNLLSVVFIIILEELQQRQVIKGLVRSDCIVDMFPANNLLFSSAMLDEAVYNEVNVTAGVSSKDILHQ